MRDGREAIPIMMGLVVLLVLVWVFPWKARPEVIEKATCDILVETALTDGYATGLREASQLQIEALSRLQEPEEVVEAPEPEKQPVRPAKPPRKARRAKPKAPPEPLWDLDLEDNDPLGGIR